MCGIVGAVAQRDVSEILVEGLRRLEYRGYDSSGLAVINSKKQLNRLRRLGKVKVLINALDVQVLSGGIGIAHTRWATHGKPSECNAHPHLSGDTIAVVHNGIIENHELLRDMLIHRGYVFTSCTDTEVIAHLVHWELAQGGVLLDAFQRTTAQLKGAYSTVVMNRLDPDRLISACSGSPLVIGLGVGENFLASDPLALLSVTRRFIFLEEGDIVEITHCNVDIYDIDGNAVEREIHELRFETCTADKGSYKHYMQKEIFEQPFAIIKTLEGRMDANTVLVDKLAHGTKDILQKADHIQIVACGTSYNAGLVAGYWFESIAGIRCDVEIASEFRYRKFVTRQNSVLITLSQSGETADTLAAQRLAKDRGFMATITVCNVASSSLVRESDIAIMTRAGTEISVASTKAFTTQLAVLLMIVTSLGKLRGTVSEKKEANIVKALQHLPVYLEIALTFDKQIESLAKGFADKQHALFLGRGEFFPIAMEASLKLKEISYIHAEAYAAGELKHGPLALVDANMPVIVIAPNNDLLEKLKSNIEEVRARGAQLYVFADKNAGFKESEGITIVQMPPVEEVCAPMFFIIPLQLLSYHVALIKGTDVDQPRNLAKSVTVE
ncbi:glutamine--fructose-6-phosphate transaminase (isomerizing) [Candidatus Enterovibrio escicola]|uniref:glutamine--fructose-6-phosphate transaminase (isomerizing) n=1 Tax=Candidatus Enterovibrio escicola TaxID=1927127 RepID=UPI001237E473|nr:glutamine--fructose-6-phosphate transaminase (isomerizing) [Candidatus Enterovibrio escacola]